MLTKGDIKQLREVIREEIESESENIQSELGTPIRLLKMELKDELSKVGNRLKNVEIKLVALEKSQFVIKKGLSKVNKTLHELRNRVAKLEESVPLSS